MNKYNKIKELKEIIMINKYMRNAKKEQLIEQTKNDYNLVGIEEKKNKTTLYYKGQSYENYDEDKFINIIDEMCHICEDDETANQYNKKVCEICNYKICYTCYDCMITANLEDDNIFVKCPKCADCLGECTKNQLFIFWNNRRLTDVIFKDVEAVSRALNYIFGLYDDLNRINNLCFTLFGILHFGEDVEFMNNFNVYICEGLTDHLYLDHVKLCVWHTARQVKYINFMMVLNKIVVKDYNKGFNMVYPINEIMKYIKQHNIELEQKTFNYLKAILDDKKCNITWEERRINNKLLDGIKICNVPKHLLVDR